MSKKAKFIEEFVITAGKGMKRKAIRKAFQNLNECGVGTFNSVCVHTKQNFQNKNWKFPLYEVMIRVAKNSDKMIMTEVIRVNNKFVINETNIHRNDPRIPVSVRNDY